MHPVGAKLIHVDSQMDTWVKDNRRYYNNNVQHYALPVFNISYKYPCVKITMTI